MLNKIKEDLLTARKERNELTASILRLVISEHELELNRGNKSTIESAIKKLIQSNNEVIKACKVIPNDRMVEHLTLENKVLSSYLPHYLTQQEVHNYLDQVKLGDNFGQNMGTLVKFFKDKGLAVEPATLKSVLESILTDS
jgi:uncharacterized protein YqeY